MVDDDASEVIVERAAGFDVHRDVVVASGACAGGRTDRGEVHRAEFATFTEDLLTLRDWLVGFGVTWVGMEATGVYWKPVFYGLEDSVGAVVAERPSSCTTCRAARLICLMRIGLVD